MNRNPDYEAGFTRVSQEDDRSPEEVARALLRAARLRKAAIAAGVAALVGVVAAGGLFLRRDTPSKQFARAQDYSQKNQHRSAVIELKRSLQGDPAQPGARFLLGKELMQVGDAKGAEIEFQKALDGRFPADQVMVALVESALRQGKFDQVVTYVNHANIQSATVNAELQTMLATAYMALDRTEAGNGAIAAARELVPNFPPALIVKARYLASRDHFDAASALLSTIPPDDKRQSEVLGLKGDIARAQRKPLEATAAYQEAVRLNPQDLTSRYSLAQTYLDLNQFEQAQAQIKVVVAASPMNPKVQFLAALVAYMRKDIAAAREAITQSVLIAPGDGNAQMLAGVIALQMQDLVEAELHLRLGVQLVPQSLQGRQILADVYLQRHEPAKADEILQPVVAALPAHRDVAILASKIAMEQGNAARASQLFDRIGILKNQDGGASMVSASLRFAAGNTAAGFEQLNAAAKANPDDPEIDVALVTNHVQARHLDAAQAAWQRLKDKQPQSARTWNLLALIAGARNDRVAARQAMEKAVALDPTYFQSVAGLALLDVEEKKVDAARQRLRTLIAATPLPTEALLLLARIERGNGGSRETVEGLLDQALKTNPRSEPVANERISFYGSQDDPVRQLAVAQDALTFAPNNQFYLFTAANLLQKTGQTPQALAMFAKLTALNTENADFQVRLGQTQLTGGQTEAAMASFRNVLKLNPRRVDVQVKVVSTFLAAGKLDEATRILFEISQLNPESPVLGEFDADIKLARKQFPEAIAAYRQALSTAPSSQLAIKTAGAYDQAKQRREAAAILDDWLKRHPKDELVMAFDAQRAIDARDYGKAVAQYRQLVQSHPDEPRLLNNFAWALAQVNDPNALWVAERASTLAPNDPDAGDTLGWILVQQGNVARGVDVIARASAQAPAKLDIKLHLAKAQIAHGQKDAARATLQSLVTAAPDSVEGQESKTLLATL